MSTGNVAITWQNVGNWEIKYALQEWFEDARGFKNIESGLKKVGFSDSETHGILGNNWYNFYKSI